MIGLRTLFNIIICFQFYTTEANNIKINGVILDKSNTPIPYTTVYAPSYSIGTVTEINGHFERSVESIPTILEFSNVGYIRAKVEVISKNYLRIILEEKTTTLDSLTIQAGDVGIIYLGSPKRKKGINVYGANYPHEQLGLKVENKHDQFYTNSNLVSFAFKNGYSSIIGGTKPNGSKQFRLRIYSISETDSTYVGDDTKQ